MEYIEIPGIIMFQFLMKYRQENNSNTITNNTIILLVEFHKNGNIYICLYNIMIIYIFIYIHIQDYDDICTYLCILHIQDYDDIPVKPTHRGMKFCSASN